MTLRSLLVVLAALPALALEGTIQVHPPGPTDETPITLIYTTTCPRNDTFTVEKSPGTILLIIKADGTCGSPPIPVTRHIPIGTLAAGTYRIDYKYSGDDFIQLAGTVHVRHARSPAEFDIHPFAVRTQPAGLRMTLIVDADEQLAICAAADCSDTTIRVGSGVATNVQRVEGQNAVTFDAPANPRGFADVLVEKRTPLVTWKYPNAVYYFDSPEISIFERILFPVLFIAPGAHGSNWLSEAVISNPNPWFVENYNTIESYVCITFPCGERLAPGFYGRTVGGNFPQGVALLVPRNEADDLAFAPRARDTSRQAESFGTEIPVVREKDLVFNRAISLLDVPLDPRFRVKLRVYAFDTDETNATVTITNPETHAVKLRSVVPLTRPCDTCASYGELDLQTGDTNESVAISITAPEGSHAWAFATVTNNSTQQVTVVTPAGGSGEP